MHISKIFQQIRGVKNFCQFGLAFCACLASFTSPLRADWSNPAIVSPAGNQYPAIALDANSNCTVSWVDGALTGIFSGAMSSNKSSWGSRGVIAEGGNEYTSASMFTDSDGNKTAAWVGFDGGYLSIQASTQAFGDTSWSDPVKLVYGDSNFTQAFVNINADSSGNLVAAWLTPMAYGQPPLVMASVLPAGNSFWTAPVQLVADPANTLTSGPSIAFGNGQAFVQWKVNDSSLVMQTATYDLTAGVWTQLPDLTLAFMYSDASTWEISADQNGNVVALISATSAITLNNVVISSTLSAGADSWTDLQVLSDPNQTSSDSIDVVTDASGNAVALWTVQDQSSGLYYVQSANLPFGGSWTDAVTLSDEYGYVYNTQLGVDSSGDVVAVWATSDDSTGNSAGYVQVANQPYQGTWSDVSTLSENGANPQIALNDQVAVTVWEDASTATPTIMASTNGELFYSSNF
jgi:hypothetical protein